MADDVQVKFGGEVSGLTAAARTAASGVKDFSDQAKSHVDGITATFGKLQQMMLGIAAIVAGGALFKEFVSATVEMTSEVTNLQKSFGLTLEEADDLADHLQLLGIKTDDYIQMAMRLDRQLRTGNESLAKMGMTAKDLDLGQKGVMDKAIRKLAEYKEGIDRNIAATVLFGRGGGEALNLVRLTIGGTAERAKELADSLHLTINPQDQANARQYKLMVNELGMAFDGIKKAIGSAVLPYLTAFGQWFVEMAPGIVSGMKDTMRSVVDWAFTIAAGFISFVVEVTRGIAKMFALWEYIQVKLGNTTLADANKSLDVFDDALKGLESFRDKSFKVLDEIKAKVLAAKPFEGINLGSAPKGTKSATSLIDDGGSGKDGISSAMREIDGQIRVLREGFNQKKALLDQELATHRITESQKIDAVRHATEQEYRAELALLQKQAQIAGLTLSQKQALLNKIAELEARHRTNQIRMDTEAIAVRQKMFQGMFDALQGAFNSQLRGLLAGTTSIKQAMKSMLGDLLIGFIQYVEKQGFQWLAGQLAMTAASTTGATARAATEAAAMEATLPVRAAKFVSDIGAAGALVFAGIFANMAPILGPAAAGPAAAGEAAVVAQLAAVPKLAVGTPWVGADGLAFLHKGEAVVPAQVNAQWQKGADGPGGGGNQFNIKALDARSFLHMLKDNAGAINKILGSKAALTA
jgi:hypothetical protein